MEHPVDVMLSLCLSLCKCSVQLSYCSYLVVIWLHLWSAFTDYGLLDCLLYIPADRLSL